MSTQEHLHTTTNRAEADRRASPRLEVLELIHGQLQALEVPITLLNMSHGGFLIQVPIEFPIGAIHEFRFTTGHGDPIVLRARSVHALRATANGVASYVVGLEFLDRGMARCEQAIESLGSQVLRLPPGLQAGSRSCEVVRPSPLTGEGDWSPLEGNFVAYSDCLPARPKKMSCINFKRSGARWCGVCQSRYSTSRVRAPRSQ